MLRRLVSRNSIRLPDEAFQFPGVKPVRTTVRADLVGGMLVEITVIAHCG